MRISAVLTVTALNLALISSAQARPKPGIFFKEPLATGLGCKNSISVSGINSNALTISFYTYRAGKYFNTHSIKQRSACALLIPIRIAKGYRLSHLSANWEGFVRAKGQFRSKYFFGRKRSVLRRKIFNKPEGGSFRKRDIIDTSAGHCHGEITNLRINNYIHAMQPKRDKKNAGIKVNKVKFLLRFKPCWVVE